MFKLAQMERRHFMALARQGFTGAAVLAAGGIATTRENAVVVRDQLVDGMDKLEARVDKMEHHHRNLLRVSALAFALSTGVDLTLLL